MNSATHPKAEPAPPGFYKMENDPFGKFEDDIPF
jgi:hypothetical protein